jgi:hypothetical protein
MKYFLFLKIFKCFKVIINFFIKPRITQLFFKHPSYNTIVSNHNPNIVRSFKLILKIGVEESIVDALYGLRINCLNLLTQVVRSQPTLQRQV